MRFFNSAASKPQKQRRFHLHEAGISASHELVQHATDFRMIAQTGQYTRVARREILYAVFTS